MRYEILPEIGVRIKDITRQKNEIWIATAAKDIHIEAPIFGKSSVGLDILYNENPIVRLWEIIETKRFWEHSSNLVFAVGRDIAGKVVIADIAKMSHVLIGGTTGSGKSVCMDSIIVSVLYKAQPNHVKMIMIDLKEVNLNVYNGIPHLLIPVITNSQKALSVLYWTVEEMFERYKKFADFGDHDLKEYNHKIKLLSLKDNSNNLKKIPQILIIINDLSDLMRINPKETEESIVRLA